MKIKMSYFIFISVITYFSSEIFLIKAVVAIAIKCQRIPTITLYFCLNEPEGEKVAITVVDNRC